ncbi:hypothetical protein [Acrocarpospora sp. B8E8]|uniref:hypothetical protein n=1 Tax=Acrocarpospora sp. B8E8 TaxID=3153572 RepID=UPI00325D7E62
MTTTTGRHRSAARAAVAGAVTLIGLIAIPVLAADTTTPVRYTCGGPTYPLTVVLDGPDTNPEPSDTITVLWRMTPASPSSPPGGGAVTESLMTAPVDLATSHAIIVDGLATISGPPLAGITVTASPSASDEPANSVTQGATMSPIPEMTILLTPSAAGTLGVVAGGFNLKISPSGGAVSTPYICTLANPASAATLAIVVATSASSSDDTDDTTTATATSTVFETETVMETETVTSTVDTTNTSTVSVTNTAQVGLTPVGGAQTGGGGTMGPDGRLITLLGTALILAAVFGGLVLRQRLSRGSDARDV